MKAQASAVSAILLLGLLLVPSAIAPCPDQPRDCSSVIGLKNVPLDDADSQLGIVEYAEEQTQTDDTFASEQQPKPSVNGYFEQGEKGAIMIIVKSMGGAGRLDFDLPDSIPAITWLGDSAISISGASTDQHFFIPFEVTGQPSSEMRFTFSASDDRGNTFNGTMSPFGNPLDGAQGGVDGGTAQTPGPGIIIVPLLAAIALLRRRQAGEQ